MLCNMRSRRRSWLVVACLLAAIVWPGAMPSAEAQSVTTRRLTVETVVRDLNGPTGFVFLARNEILIAEKGRGRVQHYRRGQFVGTALDVPVNAQGSRGLLGIETHPEVADNGFVYVYYSEAEGGDGGAWTRNVLARYRWDGARLIEPVELLSFPHREGQSNGPRHNGGTLRFGPDGKLYGQVGDLDRGRFDDPRVEQNTGDALAAGVGGIFRVRPNGAIPADNPFAEHPIDALRLWFVYGMRNGFGLAFDPLTDRLWFSENGPDVYDELNIATSGMNSGWLPLMGPDARDATYAENGDEAFDAADLVMLPGAVYRDPVFSWRKPIGVTAVVFLNSKSFPEHLRNAVVVGDANNRALHLFHPRGKRRTRLRLTGPLADTVADSREERSMNKWGRNFGITSDMRMGPDGNLYVLGHTHGVLRRVRPR